MVAVAKKVEEFVQTDIGIMPSDWLIISLDDVGNFYKGKSIPKAEITTDGEACVLYGEIYTKYNYGASELKSRTSMEVARNSFEIKKGDILFAGSGETPEDIGKCFAYLGDNRAYAGGDIVVLRPRDDYSSKFLGYILNTDIASNQKYFMGQGSSVYHIYSSSLKKLLIPIPPTKEEQEAIATVLSDMDDLINGLEKQLVKKRHLKKGAMRELLEPKAGWIEKTLGTDATLKARIGWQGLTTAEYQKTGSYYLITGTDFKDGFIDWDNCNYVSYERYNQDKNIQILNHDVLVTKDGTIGKVALIKSLHKPATLNSGVFVIRPKNNSFYPDFFYYLLLSKVFKTFLSQLSAGSTINHLYQKDFVHFKFFVPSSIEEQMKISNLLSDMDSEIEQLGLQLSKYRMIKKGMMQDLLTGKKRLI